MALENQLKFQLRPKVEIIETTLTLIEQSKPPKLPLRGKYSESLVTRGIWSEPIWTLQLIVTFCAMLYPGLFETLLPFPGEFIFLSIMILLIHPNFTGPLTNYVFGVVKPPFTFFGDSKAAKPFNALISFLAHDIWFGVFQIVGSTTVYLLKLVIKPGEILSAWWGVRKEVASHAAGQKSAGTWPSFLETSANDPLIKYVMKFKWAIVIGISILSLASYGSPMAEALHLTPHLMNIVSVSFAAILSLFSIHARMRIAKYQLWEAGKDRVEKSRIWRKSAVWTVFDVCLIATILLLSSLGAPLFSTIVSFNMVVRASTIFAGAFIFGPGAAWLVGTPRGAAKEGEKKIRSGRTQFYGIALGILFVGIGAYLTFIGLPNLSEHPTMMALAGGGDGSVSVPIPSFGVLLQLPWYCVFFFNIIVGGGMLLGALGYVLGALENLIVRPLFKAPKVERELLSAGVREAYDEWLKIRTDNGITTGDKDVREFAAVEIVDKICEDNNYRVDMLGRKRLVDMFINAIKAEEKSASPIAMRAGMPGGQFVFATAKIADDKVVDYQKLYDSSKLEPIMDVKEIIEKLLRRVTTLENLPAAVKEKLMSDEFFGANFKEKIQSLLNGKTIRIVQGNDRLMHFTEGPDLITIDKDALKHGELLFPEFIHEFLHAKLAATQTRAGPIEEETQVTTQEVETFLLFPPDAQKKILETLKADNDLDDKEFYKILEKAQAQGIDAVKIDIAAYLEKTQLRNFKGEFARVIQVGTIQDIFDFFYRITDLNKLKDVEGGAAWQLDDGTYMDQLTHVREVVHAAQMLSENNYDYFNQRRYPKGGREFNRETFAKVKAAYESL